MRATVVVRLRRWRARYRRCVVLLAIAVVVGLAIGLTRPPLGAHAVRPRVERIPLLAFGAVPERGVGAARRLGGHAVPGALAGRADRRRHGERPHHGRRRGGLRAAAEPRWPSRSTRACPVRASALVEAGVIDADEVATVELTGPRHLETASDDAPGARRRAPRPVHQRGHVVRRPDHRVRRRRCRARAEPSERSPRGRGRCDDLLVGGADERRRAPTRSGAPRRGRGRCRPPSTRRTTDVTVPVTIDLDREAEAVRSYTELVASQSR